MKQNNRLYEFLSFEEQKGHLGAEAIRKRNENRGYVDSEKYKELEIELKNKGNFKISKTCIVLQKRKKTPLYF